MFQTIPVLKYLYPFCDIRWLMSMAGRASTLPFGGRLAGNLVEPPVAISAKVFYSHMLLT